MAVQQLVDIHVLADRIGARRADDAAAQLRVQNRLYENPVESQLMLVYDENKRLIGASDVWPEEMKLPKGKLAVVMQVRAEDPPARDGLGGPPELQAITRKALSRDSADRYPDATALADALEAAGFGKVKVLTHYPQIL